MTSCTPLRSSSRLPGRTARLALLVLLATVAACASLRVYSVHDPAGEFDGYTRFDFLPLTMPAPGESNPDPLNNRVTGRRIQRAIARELEARGFQQVETEPDFRVALQIASREKLDVRTYPHTGPYFGRTWGSSYIETYTEATLIIEIADAGTRDLVWQGWVSEPVSSAAPSDERIDEVVSAILAEFPPPPENGD